MDELRALLRAATADGVREVPITEVRRRIRRRLLRRRAAACGVCAMAIGSIVVTTAVASSGDGGHSLRPTLLASASSPAGGTTAPDGCAGLPDLAEVLGTAWPSGARAAAVRVTGDPCVVDVTIGAPEPAAEDVAAARQRWGDRVVLHGVTGHPTRTAHPAP